LGGGSDGELLPVVLQVTEAGAERDKNVRMASHPYTLLFEDHPGYLFARVNAHVVGLETAVTYINETVKRVRESGAKRVLFIRDTPAAISAREYAMIGSIMMNIIPADVRVAIVDRSPTTSLVIRTINTEAEQKGRDIRAFGDLEEAKVWLLTCAG